MLSFIKHDKNNKTFTSLNDTIRCYDRLKSCDFDFTQSYDIDELHMSLTLLVAKQDHQNREIDYTRKEQLLETSNDVFSLSLAEDTHELISIGRVMRICVGSYSDSAVSKYCTIMILRNYDIPVGCIELREGAVVQAKGPCNRILQGSEKAFIKNWAEAKGLTVTTRDL